MKLWLIRHGQTPSNVLGLLDTAVPGPGLTDLGVEQAAAIPGALHDQSLTAVFASSSCCISPASRRSSRGSRFDRARGPAFRARLIDAFASRAGR